MHLASTLYKQKNVCGMMNMIALALSVVVLLAEWRCEKETEPKSRKTIEK
jgi:hypothetical protein